METKGSRRVDDVWNALKLDTRRRMRDVSSSRRSTTTVGWNSFHIRDDVKPKKKMTTLSAKSAREDSSFFADYSLTEASQIFLNSEGGLEVGCPSYECKGKCRSSKRKEGQDGNSAVEGGGTPQPDFVTLQYAKLKAAYQEKVRREKLAKCGVISGDATVAVDGENALKEGDEEPSAVTKPPPSPQTETLKNEEDPRDDIIVSSSTGNLNCDDDDVQTNYHHHLAQNTMAVGDIPLKEDEEAFSTNLPPPRTETLKKEEDLQDDRSSCTVDLNCDGDDVVQTDDHHHLVQEHSSEEKFEKMKELVGKGVVKCGSITDVGLGESGKGSDPSRKGDKKVVDGVGATTGAPRSVRFSLPEGATKSLGSSDDGTDANALPDGEGDRNQKLSNAVTRDLNCLTDASPGVRLAALQRLQSTLFGDTPKANEEKRSGQSAEEDGLSKESWRHSLGWAAEELVIKPLLRRFGDPFEKCRMLAIAILKQ